MAKEFDFKKDGKKQTAFKTPMLNSKVSPAQARLAGKRKQELARNPQGSQYGFDAGALSFALPVGKVAKAGFSLLRKSNIAGAETVARRLAAKAAGRSAGRDIAAAGGKKYLDSEMGKFSILGGGAKAKISEGSAMRKASEKVFQRDTNLVGRAIRADGEIALSAKNNANVQYGFDRFAQQYDKTLRKYGLNQKTFEEGRKQVAKRVKSLRNK